MEAAVANGTRLVPDGLVAAGTGRVAAATGLVPTGARPVPEGLGLPHRQSTTVIGSQAIGSPTGLSMLLRPNWMRTFFRSVKETPTRVLIGIIVIRINYWLVRRVLTGIAIVATLSV